MRNWDTKRRLLAVLYILNGRGRVTMAQILSDLDLRYDIKATRKVVYDDIWTIDKFQPVTLSKDRDNVWYYSIKK